MLRDICATFLARNTYRRLDKPGVFHTRWGQDGAEEQMG